MAFSLISCQSSTPKKSLAQRYLAFYPEVQNGWVFVLPQNTCIPCNRMAYQWWQRQSEAENTYLIADYPLFKLEPKDPSATHLFIDTIPYRMAQHNPYVTKSFAMRVEGGTVVDQFPIDPKNVQHLDSLLEIHEEIARF